MLGPRKTWDLGHAPCLRDLWKNDFSLDASSVDFLMSEGEDEASSFLSLPSPAFSQHPLPSAELSQSNAPMQQEQQQLIQALQDKVRHLQARLDEEDAARQCLFQQQHTPAGGRPREDRVAGSGGVDKEQLSRRLHSQVEELEKKLVEQTQEVERLRSGLGATDLEKHLELLEAENKSLKRQLASGGASNGASNGAYEGACSCTQELEALRRELIGWEKRGQQTERHLADVEGQLLDKTAQADALQRRLDRAGAPVGLAERDLAIHLRDKSAPLQAAEEAESGDSAASLRVQNALLQEQICVQRHLLRELEAQVQQSQRACAQLRTQVAVYDGEMTRAHKQLDAELLQLKEEKERVIHEAFLRAESQMKAVHDNLAGVRSKLLGLHPALRTLTSDYNTLKKQVHHFPRMLQNAIDDAKHEICQVISEVSLSNQKLVDRYKREMNLRKKIHNQLVQLKGNIRVLCRVRPVDGAQEESVLTFDPDDDCVLYLSNKGKVVTFALDKVFPPQATQEEVFAEVESLVTSCVDGFNVCIFAYGQTGSGKTYTMEGVPSDPGLNQRALHLLFSQVTDKSPEWEFHICVSMLEIYNETLRDLLGDKQADKLDIKMNPDGSGQLYVPGLTRVAVRTVDDVNKVLEAGRASRATACTNLNERSSRSHALLVVSVTGLNGTTGSRTQGKLNLVDLAGSERLRKSGAEGGRLREAQHINKSLSALGDVINALRCKHAHVPFRNSRLTFLLQDSLQGDSKTLMMVQVSPVLRNVTESLCSLKFAQRVRSVELNSSSSASRRTDDRSASSSPTQESLETDSPPLTPGPLPLSRSSSAGSSLNSASRTPNSSRRKSNSQLSTGRLKMAA
ncbi:kinesin-like protein KIFC3 isoform X2 [Syngnathoides biaculeatus]|uniref:kinesin-like protein KIFC3 isoform X2 n=1 Tax=Syngnathoides biaculeatus TaxID=300417 RepID=UPI002ADE34C3|nr:kinesin-like protein KIFC3 isoform X2 [Syngnathoides biaculeatus]XP_061669396.1 kinesin-like protein KIFC3 isoform X2 [Syngnathoides biaculeatus]XP_061669397.1 kinesin-like protein KIFC3 isoform X2 [Syngnathoides biaculeatus]